MYHISSENVPVIIFGILLFGGEIFWQRCSMLMTPYVRNLFALIPFSVSSILFFIFIYEEWEYYFLVLGITFLVSLSYEFFPHGMENYKRDWIPRSDTPRRGTVTFLQDFLFGFGFLLTLFEIWALLLYIQEIFFTE